MTGNNQKSKNIHGVPYKNTMFLTFLVKLDIIN